MKQRTQVVVMYTDGPAAMCLHGLSPAIECIKNPNTCPCGYVEGRCPPNYPVPAIPYVLELEPRFTRLSRTHTFNDERGWYYGAQEVVIYAGKE